MSFSGNVKSKFRKIFSTEKPQQETEKEKLPGTQEVKKDIGKEVFEKTGRIREGVGQSSTRSRQNVVPPDTKAVLQEKPIKGHHGIKQRGFKKSEPNKE